MPTFVRGTTAGARPGRSRAGPPRRSGRGRPGRGCHGHGTPSRSRRRAADRDRKAKRPEGREEEVMRPIDREELERLIADGAQLVEVLPREEYEEEHLPGAISIPLKELDAGSVKVLDRDRPVVAYCYDYQ